LGQKKKKKKSDFKKGKIKGNLKKVGGKNWGSIYFKYGSLEKGEYRWGLKDKHI